jgi:hypothetical protein
VFVPGRPLKPSLMFVSQAGVYLRVGHLKGASLGHYSQILNQAGKASQGQTREGLLEGKAQYR